MPYITIYLVFGAAAARSRAETRSESQELSKVEKGDAPWSQTPTWSGGPQATFRGVFSVIFLRFPQFMTLSAFWGSRSHFGSVIQLQDHQATLHGGLPG